MKKQNLLSILFLTLSVGHAQNKRAELTQQLETLYRQSDFVGFSVAVVSKDSVLYQNAFGFADLENKKPYTVLTVQNIASVSKIFVGVCLMKAIELGYFDLETNINDILPFKVANPNFPADVIKIKHLATHTSGIDDREDVYYKNFIIGSYSDPKSPLYDKFVKTGTIPNRKDSTLAVFLYEYFDKNGSRYSPRNFLNYKPGEVYQYSNIGAALAAYLIEVKAKIPFDEFCNKHVLQPLNMTQTSWRLTDKIVQQHARIYNAKRQYYPLYSEVTYPDGSLRTSCADLSKYLLEMIRGYNKRSKLLTDKSFETLFKKQFDDSNLPKNSSKQEPNSGIFWRYKPNGLIGHTGGDIGATSFVFFDPKSGIGRIFVSNTELDSPEQAKPNEKLVKQFIAIWKTLEQ
jgi:CubicO group peptidase (beta-lactamase class C family)